jgi:hypothetical protein
MVQREERDGPPRGGRRGGEEGRGPAVTRACDVKIEKRSPALERGGGIPSHERCDGYGSTAWVARFEGAPLSELVRAARLKGRALARAQALLSEGDWETNLAWDGGGPMSPYSIRRVLHVLDDAQCRRLGRDGGERSARRSEVVEPPFMPAAMTVAELRARFGRSEAFVRRKGRWIDIATTAGPGRWRRHLYSFELSRCDTPAKALGWCRHLAEKDWMTATMIVEFIQVLREAGVEVDMNC